VLAAITTCCAILLLAGLTARAVHHGRVISRLVNVLYRAAASGDHARLRDWLDRGHSIDLQDHEGNTALHFAYYQGQQDAIDALIAYGADNNLHNKEGLSPAEMYLLATIEDQLDRTRRLFEPAGAAGGTRNAAGRSTVGSSNMTPVFTIPRSSAVYYAATSGGNCCDWPSSPRIWRPIISTRDHRY
jgi:ankyrin repeat protein